MRNGYRWNVRAVTVDGWVDVVHLATGRSTVLPPAYVGEWVRLGYASTIHGAQGVTVDTAHTVVDPTMSSDLLYVGMTRGRAEVGDDLGSAVVAARQVREVMKLGLLMDRIYPPYSKWLGTAFATTAGAGQLTPHLMAAVVASTWFEREQNLCAAYEIVAALHNARGLADPLDTTVRPFHTRPNLVLDAYRFADALWTPSPTRASGPSHAWVPSTSTSTAPS